MRELEDALVGGEEGGEALSPFTSLLPVTRMLSKDATTVDDVRAGEGGLGRGGWGGQVAGWEWVRHVTGVTHWVGWVMLCAGVL